MAYTLTATYNTPPSAVLTLTSDSAFSTAPRYRFKIYSDDAGTQLVTGSGWITLSEASTTITYTVASIDSGTYYVTAESDDPQTFVSLQQVVLTDNTPKTATQAQWEDLAIKVNNKAEIGSVLSTPSDVAYIASANIIDEAVTTGKIANSAVTADKTDFGGNYSTSEVDTGFTWIDGSPIYKKTVNFGALPNASNKSVAHGISNLNYVIHYYGMTTHTGDSIFRPLPIVNPSGDASQAIFEFDATNIYCYVSSGSDMSTYSAYITIYYTKSS